MAVVSVHKLVAPLTNAFHGKTSSSTKNKIYSKLFTNKFNICIILTKKLALSDTQKIYVDCEVRYWYLVMESQNNVGKSGKLEEDKVDELTGEVQPEPVGVGNVIRVWAGRVRLTALHGQQD